MINFFRGRGFSLALVVLVMTFLAMMQAGISYSVGRGPLHDLVPAFLPTFLAVTYALRISLLLVLVTLWALGRKRALFRMIIVANGFFTAILILDTVALIGVLGGFKEAAQALLIDAALMCVSNILIFSIWYWVVDPPGVEDEPNDTTPWAFLFPQRQMSSYERWIPDYVDYLFIAFTTSFAFSPTDAMPLTRLAKMLMLVQASISVVIVLGIAGGAINAVVGG